MTEYRIEKPVLKDADGLIAMHAQSWIDTYPNDSQGVTREFIEEHIKEFSSEEGKERRLNYIKESYDNPDYYFRVAKDEDGKIVGFVDARRGKEPELCGLYIDKSTQGSGLARQMAEPALRWLGMENDIKLVVVAYNERAQAFYKKFGFEKVSGSENFHDNKPLSVIEMIRKGDS
jgi:ribosomal protein S18 acetylase RimI-like enzyme